MDLNKAMTDLYKNQAWKVSTRSHGAKKKPKVDSSNDIATDTTNNEQDEQLKEAGMKPKATFDKLFGCDSARNDIIKIVDHFIKPHAYEESDSPKLILGSKGLGKTSLVEAAANYSGLKYFRIGLYSMDYLSRGEFKEIMEHKIRCCLTIQPAIVLIDDLNALNEKDDLKSLARIAIQELIKPENKLLVFCTTSSTLKELPGVEFASVIYLKRPNGDGRYQILKSIISEHNNQPKASEELLRYMATNTPTFTATNLLRSLEIAERDGVVLTKESCDHAVEEVRQSLRQGTHLIGERPSVTWKDIGGMSSIKEQFQRILKRSKTRVNCKYAGILLYGPPGCGKTMVAQAMANEGGFNFISIKPSELVNKYLGETERNIRRVFFEAREHEPCIVYFDEFDGLCGSRASKDNLTNSIHTLLSEMDGFNNRGQSIILAATNRLEDIDEAMKRPGRLTDHIYVGPPDQNARRDILRVVTSRPHLSLDSSVNLDDWAKKTENFTGADLGLLIEKAEAFADREVDCATENSIVLKKEHFEFGFAEAKKNKKDKGERNQVVDQDKSIGELRHLLRSLIK